jgi:hypothetical protein
VAGIAAGDGEALAERGLQHGRGFYRKIDIVLNYFLSIRFMVLPAIRRWGYTQHIRVLLRTTDAQDVTDSSITGQKSVTSCQSVFWNDGKSQ